MKNLHILIAALTMLVILPLLPVSAYAQVERYEIPVSASPFKGPADAPITIIEFLDFQ